MFTSINFNEKTSTLTINGLTDSATRKLTRRNLKAELADRGGMPLLYKMFGSKFTVDAKKTKQALVASIKSSYFNSLNQDDTISQDVYFASMRILNQSDDSTIKTLIESIENGLKEAWAFEMLPESQIEKLVTLLSEPTEHLVPSIEIKKFIDTDWKEFSASFKRSYASARKNKVVAIN